MKLSFIFCAVLQLRRLEVVSCFDLDKLKKLEVHFGLYESFGFIEKTK